MPDYNQSQETMIGVLGGGLRVETTTLAAATYLKTGGVSTACFNVYGRNQINQMYIEVQTALGAQACQITFFFDASTPAVASNPMGAKCASVSGQGQGARVVYIGGVVAGTCVITDSACLSDVTCVAPTFIGIESGVGTLGPTSSDASLLSGTFRMVVHYLPMSDGAYIDPIL